MTKAYVRFGFDPSTDNDLIPTKDGDYIILEPNKAYPAKIPEEIEDDEFNTEIEVEGETYIVNSIDLDFV